MTQEATQAPAVRPAASDPAVEAAVGDRGVAPGRGLLARAVAQARASEAVRAAWRAFLWSRVAIAVVAVFAALSAGEVVKRDASKFDIPAITAPLGGVGEIATAPLARWDAVWYLSIANYGYESADSPRHAFFPLYPLLARGVGELGGGGEGATLLGAYAVALAAFLAALVLLYRLTALELGRRAAWPALLLLCTFPASLYFGAPYAESVFLLCSVGAFYAARTGSWAWAGVAAAGASATRSAGVLLLAPLVVLYLYGPRADAAATVRGSSSPGTRAAPPDSWLRRVRPRFRLRADFLWLALAPAGLVAYAAYLGFAYGDPLSFSHVQEFWNRSFAGPLVGVWDGAVAAFDGVRQLLSGAREPV